VYFGDGTGPTRTVWDAQTGRELWDAESGIATQMRLVTGAPSVARRPALRGPRQEVGEGVARSGSPAMAAAPSAAVFPRSISVTANYCGKSYTIPHRGPRHGGNQQQKGVQFVRDLLGAGHLELSHN